MSYLDDVLDAPGRVIRPLPRPARLGTLDALVAALVTIHTARPSVEIEFQRPNAVLERGR